MERHREHENVEKSAKQQLVLQRYIVVRIGQNAILIVFEEEIDHFSRRKKLLIQLLQLF